MENYIGLNIGGHDSSAVMLEIEENEILGTSIYLSERLTKIKHQGGFPFQALKLLKKDFSSQVNDLPSDHIGVNHFGSASLEKYLTENNVIILELHQFQKFNILNNIEHFFLTHHLCHAYSSLLQCPFDKAIIVVFDGIGNHAQEFHQDHPEYFLTKKFPESRESLSVYLMNHGELKAIKKDLIRFEDTDHQNIKTSEGLGSLFEAASYALFGDWSFAGKVMGLAAYGTPHEITDPKTYITHLASLNIKIAEGKKAFDAQSPEDFQNKADIAASVQFFFEEKMIKLLNDLKIQHPQYENLILVGGCALNCLLNSRILRERIFTQVFIPPFPNDEGISLGAALALAYQKNKVRFKVTPYEKMTASLGSITYSSQNQQSEVEKLFIGYKITKPQNLTQQVAQKLADGEIIAWIQGRSEVGPRALGSRSLLVRPDSLNIKKRLNDTIKFREEFRPYGATILSERVQDFYEVENEIHSPFMTFSPKMKNEFRQRFEGIVHKDGTSRIQTLLKGQNPIFYQLIKDFEAITQVPILLNTSLNIMGQPILESIHDAHYFMETSKIKTMVFGEYLILC